MIIFYIPNPTQYLNLTTALQTINKQQKKAAKSLLREKKILPCLHATKLQW